MSIKPERLSTLSPERRTSLMKRSMEDISSIFASTLEIVKAIQKEGDKISVEHYKKLKPDITASDFKVTEKEIKEAYGQVEEDVISALKVAANNIEKFHKAQLEREMWSIEVEPGILAGRLYRAMEVVGAYIPGRQANYPSSVLMTIIPARVAGVDRVIACTPPGDGLTANPTSLVAADIAGADEIFKIGGPWAVASMAFGTDTVPRVDKIVGPGNKYVTAAKMAVFGHVDIDSPAGPSEALILADETANPKWIALDFLSQIEHDPDAAAILITTSEKLAEEVCEIIKDELPKLQRKEIIEQALQKHSAVLIADTKEDAISFTNEYATEHLEIITKDPFADLMLIRHAGSIFLGPYAPVPVGDYASGTNHVLPTGQCARMFSGLSVDDFIKKPTFQYLTREGLHSLKDVVIRLAEKEELYLHARTVAERFK